MRSSTTSPPLLIPTLPADSRAWMRRDLPSRLLPFGALVAGVWMRAGRPAWLGMGAGRLPVQLGFGIAGGVALFIAGAAVQLLTLRVRGAVKVPASTADAALQAGYYALNAPVEEAVFRGLVQGGIGRGHAGLGQGDGRIGSVDQLQSVGQVNGQQVAPRRARQRGRGNNEGGSDGY